MSSSASIIHLYDDDDDDDDGDDEMLVMAYGHRRLTTVHSLLSMGGVSPMPTGRVGSR